MGKIFRTEKLSLNADNIRIRSDEKGEFAITDSDNTVLISRQTIESDISSLALQNSQSSLQNVEQNSDISSLAITVTTNDSDLSSLAATDVTHSSDISSLATSLGGDTTALNSDISSLASASSLESSRRDSDVSSLALASENADIAHSSDISSLAGTITSNDSDLSSLAATDVTHDSDISSLASASSLESSRRDSDVSSLANTVTTNDSDLSSLAATDVTHSSDISSLATSLGGGTAQLDSDISSLASSSSLEAKQVDADVSSLAALITTNDVYAQTVSLEDAFNNEQAFVTIDYSQAGFATPPSVVGTMISFEADDPIMGVQLSGQPTTTSATFVFSDELPSTGYKLEVLSAV